MAVLGTIRPQALVEGGDYAGVDIAEVDALAAGMTPEAAAHLAAPQGVRPPAGPTTRLRPVTTRDDLERVGSIAVLRALPGVGDMLCAVPALRTLRRRYPDARIGLVGLWSSRWMLDAYPGYVDELLPIDGLPLLCPPPADVEGAMAALAEARRQRFDLAVQLHGDGSLSNLVTAMIGARHALVHHPLDRPAPEGAMAVPYPGRGHEVVRLLELVDRLGVVGEAHLEPPDPAAQLPGAQLVAGLSVPPEGFAVIHPGASTASRRWSVAGFAAVASWLLDHDVAVVVTGTESEQELVDEIRRREPAIVDLCGRTGVNELAGVITSARLVVTNDTGVAHLAAAVRAPSVVTFLGDDPGRWAPLDSVRHRLVPLAHVPEGDGDDSSSSYPSSSAPPGASDRPPPCADLLHVELATVIDAVAEQLGRFGPEGTR
jgi:ADP-heptose:LPS heptosyltransferase